MKNKWLNSIPGRFEIKCMTENEPENHTEDQEMYKIREDKFQGEQQPKSEKIKVGSSKGDPGFLTDPFQITTFNRGNSQNNKNSRAVVYINQWDNCICLEGRSQSLIEPTRNEIKNKTADEIWNQGCPKK